MRILDHKNIIKLENYFLLNNENLVLLLEYVEGGTLKEYLNEKIKLEEDETRNIIKTLLNVLKYCHDKDIIHKDLKPTNLMYSNSNRSLIKVIDFGISGILNRENILAGTIRYLPPEVISGDYENDPLIDCWAVGCITYELLTGEKLFKGESNSEIKVNYLYRKTY